jgi:AcrR family transcriptional regulator
MSSSSAHTRATKTRPYKLQKRAESRDQTRRRIIEAAVDLHCTVGPARTTVSQIAKRAGVQRHTYYAHFPDDRSLFLACSELALEHGPLPEVARLKDLKAGRDRIRTGLELFYGWFEQNREHAASVLRDAANHALTRQMVELRIAPAFHEAAEIMGEGLSDRSRVMLGLALDFHCWPRLSEKYSAVDAAALMTEAIVLVG